MLNLSILDYPDHADPVKRLTEHLVNKLCLPSRAPYRSGNSASVRTQPSATRPQCALMLARDLLSSFWRRGEPATTRLSTSSSSTGAIKTVTALPLRSRSASGCDSPGLLNKPAARLRKIQSEPAHLNSSKRILLLENPESVRMLALLRMLALFRLNLGSNANEK